MGRRMSTGTLLYEIPLIAQAQTFRVTLAGTPYRFTLAWRDGGALGGAWLLDVADGNGKALLAGVPLVTGADLLGPFRYLGFGGGLYVVSDADAAAAPSYPVLGQQAHLYWCPDA